MGGLKMKEDLRVVKNEEVVNEELNKDKDENKKILKEYEDELGY
jgi:hypothetical protein